MKKIISFSLFFMLLFSLPMSGLKGTNATAQAQQMIQIMGDGVRLRLSPSTNGKILTGKNRGFCLPYRYTTSDGEWYCGTYKNKTVYVSTDYARIIYSGYSSSYTQVYVHATNLLVRKGPGRNYPYLIWRNGEHVRLDYGDVLPYLGETRNGFHKVRFDGKACWISAKYSSLR